MVELMRKTKKISPVQSDQNADPRAGERQMKSKKNDVSINGTKI